MKACPSHFRRTAKVSSASFQPFSPERNKERDTCISQHNRLSSTFLILRALFYTSPKPKQQFKRSTKCLSIMMNGSREVHDFKFPLQKISIVHKRFDRRQHMYSSERSQNIDKIRKSTACYYAQKQSQPPPVSTIEYLGKLIATCISYAY